MEAVLGRNIVSFMGVTLDFLTGEIGWASTGDISAGKDNLLLEQGVGDFMLLESGVGDVILLE